MLAANVQFLRHSVLQYAGPSYRELPLLKLQKIGTREDLLWRSFRKPLASTAARADSKRDNENRKKK